MSSISSASGRLRPNFHRHETKLASLLLLLGIALAVAAPRFFSSVNLALLARSMGVLLIVSVGMLNVILAGGIDVSAGAILAVVSVALVRLGNHELPASVVLPLGLLSGASLGAVNAALIAELQIPPIVATLGTAGLFRGLLLEWTQGEWESSIPPWLNAIGSPRWGGLDASVLAAALVMLAVIRRSQRHAPAFPRGSRFISRTFRLVY
jgi:ribose/xylose/arabinose/galactoside ABC-type transport system permease subunit